MRGSSPLHGVWQCSKRGRKRKMDFRTQPTPHPKTHTKGGQEPDPPLLHPERPTHKKDFGHPSLAHPGAQNGHQLWCQKQKFRYPKMGSYLVLVLGTVFGAVINFLKVAPFLVPKTSTKYDPILGYRKVCVWTKIGGHFGRQMVHIWVPGSGPMGAFSGYPMGRVFVTRDETTTKPQPSIYEAKHSGRRARSEHACMMQREQYGNVRKEDEKERWISAPNRHHTQRPTPRADRNPTPRSCTPKGRLTKRTSGTQVWPILAPKMGTNFGAKSKSFGTPKWGHIWYSFWVPFSVPLLTF